MKPSTQQVTIRVTEFTNLIHSVVTDPKIGNSSDMYKTIVNHVNSLSPEDFAKVNEAYQKSYKKNLKSIFGSFGIGSTEHLNII